MTLIHSSSKQAFQQNIKKEIQAGKPQKQAVAIAYSVKRKNKRYTKEQVEAARKSRSSNKHVQLDYERNQFN